MTDRDAPLLVGNASGFYGDRFEAFAEMLTGGPLDVLSGDYLAELTMLILARDQRRDPGTGYARTFLRQMRECLGLALDREVAIVVNAGGLNPAGLAGALGELAGELGRAVRIGYVTGDAVDRAGALCANAYLGAFGIARCLTGGAQVVVTGRVTDASLVVGPAIARFGWTRDDLGPLAGGTVAGHVLECGAQATGGNFAFFTELPDLDHPGFPIAEVGADGSSVITKHPGTGGAVTVETVTAQLLYETGSPGYLGPDVVAHLDHVALTQLGPDRVGIGPVTGSPPPPTLKVGVNRLGGYRNTMTFVLTGLDIPAKAALVRRQLTAAVGAAGLEFTLARTDRPDAPDTETASALLRVHLRDADPGRAGRRFSQAAVALALASYPGCTLTTPPGDATPFGVFTAEAIGQHDVEHTAVLPGGQRVPIEPPARTADPTTVDSATAQPATAQPVTAEPTAAEPVAAEPVATEPAAAGPATAQPVAAPAVSRRPLGSVLGARSGDKGGDANLGVWARSDTGWAWLRGYLTVAELRRLLPETTELVIDRYELPRLRAVNFVLHGLLGPGVAGSTRFDPQAKALGELLRARYADIPVELR